MQRPLRYGSNENPETVSVERTSETSSTTTLTLSAVGESRQQRGEEENKNVNINRYYIPVPLKRPASRESFRGTDFHLRRVPSNDITTRKLHSGMYEEPIAKSPSLSGERNEEESS